MESRKVEMPFQPIEAGKGSYLLDEDVLVDSQIDKQDNETNIDFTVTLQKVLNNVIAMEVSEIEIDRAMVGAFSLEKWIDVTLYVDPRTGADPTPHTFSAKLPALDGTSTPQELAAVVALTLNNAVREAFTDGNWIEFNGSATTSVGAPDFFTDNVILVVSCQIDSAGPGIDPNPNALETLGFEPPGSGNIPTRIVFNFGTGPNAAESISRIIGVKVGVDIECVFQFNGSIVLPLYFTDLSGTYTPTTTPYPYIDIFIDEIPEFQPFFRFYPPNPLYTRRQLLPARSRIITNPIKRMNKLRVRVRHQNGIRPTPEYPIFFHLRISHMVEGGGVPEYLTERIIVK